MIFYRLAVLLLLILILARAGEIRRNVFELTVTLELIKQKVEGR